MGEAVTSATGRTNGYAGVPRSWGRSARARDWASGAGARSWRVVASWWSWAAWRLEGWRIRAVDPIVEGALERLARALAWVADRWRSSSVAAAERLAPIVVPRLEALARWAGDVASAASRRREAVALRVRAIAEDRVIPAVRRAASAAEERVTPLAGAIVAPAKRAADRAGRFWPRSLDGATAWWLVGAAAAAGLAWYLNRPAGPAPATPEELAAARAFVTPAPGQAQGPAPSQ